jgi:hypothetical protein
MGVNVRVGVDERDVIQFVEQSFAECFGHGAKNGLWGALQSDQSCKKLRRSARRHHGIDALVGC